MGPAPLASRPALRLLPVLAMPALLGGCLESREDLSLRPDGGGRITVRYDLVERALGDLRADLRARLPDLLGVAALPAEAEAAAAARVRPLDPGWFREAARGVAGYVLDTPTALPAGPGRVALEIRATFDSLEAAARGGAFLGAATSLERLPRRLWRFRLREPWTPAGPGAADAFGGIDPERLRAALAPHLAALSHRLTLSFPAPVESTNGERSADGRTVAWSARADAAAPEPLTVTFPLPADVAWPTYRHAPDLARLARRFLEPPPPAPAPAREPEEAPAPTAPGR